MCTFEPEKPEASVDRGARELPLSPGHDPSKTSSFFACNKRYVKCIKSRYTGHFGFILKGYSPDLIN